MRAGPEMLSGLTFIASVYLAVHDVAYSRINILIRAYNLEV